MHMYTCTDVRSTNPINFAASQNLVQRLSFIRRLEKVSYGFVVGTRKSIICSQCPAFFHSNSVELTDQDAVAISTPMGYACDRHVRSRMGSGQGVLAVGFSSA